jgi:hypothetical protein
MPRSEAQLHSASAGAAMIFSRPASHFGRSGRQGIDGSLTGFSLFSLTHLAGPDVRGRHDVLVGKSPYPICHVCEDFWMAQGLSVGKLDSDARALPCGVACTGRAMCLGKQARNGLLRMLSVNPGTLPETRARFSDGTWCGR